MSVSAPQNDGVARPRRSAVVGAHGDAGGHAQEADVPDGFSAQPVGEPDVVEAERLVRDDDGRDPPRTALEARGGAQEGVPARVGREQRLPREGAAVAVPLVAGAPNQMVIPVWRAVSGLPVLPRTAACTSAASAAEAELDLFALDPRVWRPCAPPQRRGRPGPTTPRWGCGARRWRAARPPRAALRSEACDQRRRLGSMARTASEVDGRQRGGREIRQSRGSTARSRRPAPRARSQSAGPGRRSVEQAWRRSRSRRRGRSPRRRRGTAPDPWWRRRRRGPRPRSRQVSQERTSTGTAADVSADLSSARVRWSRDV